MNPIHCILSHHGELEYGSEKLRQRSALNLADNTDARMETIMIFAATRVKRGFGYNKLFESNLRRNDEV